MPLSPKAQALFDQVNTPATKLGDLRKLAKEIKKDHELAVELWDSGAYYPRQLAILIMDKKQLTQEVIDQLAADIEQHDLAERTHLIDWLMANQLSKDKKAIALMESWENSPSALQRRIFWYYQARLRWMGKTPPPNSAQLLEAVAARMADEVPEVQWAMNFTTGWIGVHEPAFRDQCVSLGERIGLYQDEKVPKNCTPNYLPEFIRIEADKVGK